jgi:hypothetical protein
MSIWSKFESGINKAGTKIRSGIDATGDAIKDKAREVVRNRETRLSNPAFQAELKASRDKLGSHLGNMGKETFMTFIQLLILAAPKTTLYALKGMIGMKDTKLDRRNRTVSIEITKEMMFNKLVDEFFKKTAGHAVNALEHGANSMGRLMIHLARWFAAK